MKKLILATVAAISTLGAVSAAVAQPPPPGWGPGPHYYWHGRHWHNRAWAWGPHHRGYWRYW